MWIPSLSREDFLLEFDTEKIVLNVDEVDLPTHERGKGEQSVLCKVAPGVVVENGLLGCQSTADGREVDSQYVANLT